jgi:uncharacterized membrane protein YfcA
MPMISAVGSSLVSVTAFGLTTALNYSLSGLVDWRMAAIFIAGGMVGGVFGQRAARALETRKQLLAKVFAIIVASVGVYVVGKGFGLI